MTQEVLDLLVQVLVVVFLLIAVCVLLLIVLLAFGKGPKPKVVAAPKRRLMPRIAEYAYAGVLRIRRLLSRVFALIKTVVIIPLLTFMIIMCMVAVLEGVNYKFLEAMAKLWSLYSHILDGLILLLWKLPQLVWRVLRIIF